MGILKEKFGEMADGTQVDLFTLINKNGVEAKITTYGGTLVGLLAPDRNGVLEDIVLGYDTLEGFQQGKSYFGALIGRHANRIEKATFDLDGVTYALAVNDGNNHLHGGLVGFDKVVWAAETFEDADQVTLRLTYTSKDMEESYPGNLQVKVDYCLTQNNGLIMKYEAVSDQKTVINLTNHGYFNLKGHGNGDIIEHQVMINADTFTVVNDECIPIGEIRSVEGTPMDFRIAKTLGDGLNSGYEQIVAGNGYDHNWVLNTQGDLTQLAASACDTESGRVLEVYTTKPGIQFYSGNYVNEMGTGKKGSTYVRRGGLCLETQYYPNALNHPHFPSPIFEAGQVYQHTTIYQLQVMA